MQIGSIQSGTTSAALSAAKTTKVALPASYDPADTNQDGVVSPAEALAYALKHPELDLLKAAGANPAQYTKNGTANAPAAQNGLLDLNA
ncbi:MAG TPA: hypothetical protein VJ549_03210 [Geothrix sp.]|nr:hypothetical protein [Geothrix sp.]